MAPCSTAGRATPPSLSWSAPRPIRTTRLLAATAGALDAGIRAATPGNKIGDISAAIGTVGRRAGCGINTDFGGHGIGHTMHEMPSVPNEGRAGRGLKIRPGLVIAIEPWFLGGGNDGYRIDDDGWTCAAPTAAAARISSTPWPSPPMGRGS